MSLQDTITYLLIAAATCIVGLRIYRSIFHKNGRCDGDGVNGKCTDCDSTDCIMRKYNKDYKRSKNN